MKSYFIYDLLVTGAYLRNTFDEEKGLHVKGNNISRHFFIHGEVKSIVHHKNRFLK